MRRRFLEHSVGYLFICLAVPLLVMSWAERVRGAIASGETYTLRQPDGTLLKATQKGDEWWHWTENTYGYATGKSEDGYWYYLDTSTDEYRQPLTETDDAAETTRLRVPLTGIKGHEPPPKGLRRYVPPEGEYRAYGEEKRSSNAANLNRATTFNGNVLLILVEFDNQKGRYGPGRWGDDDDGTLTKIFRFFNVASYRKATLLPATEKSRIVNDGVVGWLNVSALLKKLEIAQNVADQSGNHPNTGPGQLREGRGLMLNRLLAKAAILQADPFVKFSRYDTDGNGFLTPNELAVQIVVAGYEAASVVPPGGKSVWAHAWNIPAASVGLPKVDGKKISAYSMVGEIHGSRGDHQATYGTMVHELGHHIFGWPDLYNVKTGEDGIGPWDIMGTGNWGRTSGQAHLGQTPVLPSAYIKKRSGWITPQEPETFPRGVVPLTAAGSLAAKDSNTVAIARTYLATEYFLIENRQNIGYDKGLQGPKGLDQANWVGGLAIWHIDETIGNNHVDAHRLVDLEGANGGHGADTAGGALYLRADVLWGKESIFGPRSTSNSKLYNGRSSEWVLTDIPAPKDTMSPRIVQNGVVTVTIEPDAVVDAGAKWQACDKNGICYVWAASGMNWRAIPDPYTIRFNGVAGWITPDPVTLTIEANVRKQVTGTYEKQVTETTVTVNPYTDTVYFSNENGEIPLPLLYYDITAQAQTSEEMYYSTACQIPYDLDSYLWDPSHEYLGDIKEKKTLTRLIFHFYERPLTRTVVNCMVFIEDAASDVKAAAEFKMTLVP